VPPRKGKSTVTASSATCTQLTAEDYRRIAADQGFVFETGRYTTALALHAGMRAALARLRDVRLSFLEPTEPESALQWIANGGRS
jgi:hypothetical protein